MSQKTSRLALAAALLITSLAVQADLPAWLEADSVEGLITCTLTEREDLVVSYAEIRADGEQEGHLLIGERCSDALASVQRRRDLDVEAPVGLVPGRDDLVFDVRGPHRPVPTLIGCRIVAETLEVAWTDDPERDEDLVGKPCLEVIGEARARGLGITNATQLRRTADLMGSNGMQSLVSTYTGSRGRPDRPSTVMGCELSATDELRLSFVDTSDEALPREGLIPGDDCVQARRLLSELALLTAPPAITASLADELGQPEHLYYGVHTGGAAEASNNTWGCENFPDSAPAGDLLLVTDKEGEIVRSEPIACSLLGAEAGMNGLQYEVAISADYIRLAGGIDDILEGRVSPLNCGFCRELKGEPTLPAGSGGYWGGFTTPLVVETLGVIGDYPHGVAPMPGGLWHVSTHPPSGISQSSYCALGPEKGRWGLLSNSRGFEIEETNGLVHWGNTAYTAYDAAHGYIRAANLYPDSYDHVSIGYWLMLRTPGRLDICGF